MKLINPASKAIFIFPVLFLILAGPVSAETKDKKGCEQAAWYLDEGNKLIQAEPQKAEALYREALGRCPESINARYNLGISLYNQKKNPDAIEVFKGLLEKNPDHTDAMRMLSYILVKENIDPQRGKILAEKILETNPKDETARKILMLSLMGSTPSTPVPKTPSLSASASAKSDVDDLPAIKTKQRNNAYAIVIGIEQYREKLPKADFAKHDAEVVTEYLTKVMGYPEENVITLVNDRALKSDLEKYIERWLPNNVEKDGTLFIYYSGHGAPNPKTGDAYLVPYDGDPTFIEQTGYSLKRLYESLSRLKAKEIVVALDSCFSGAGGRSVIAKGARPMVITSEGTMPISQNVAVISAAGGEEISSTYDEKGHGLFTYFMLKGLKGEADTDANGKIEIQELYNYIKPQVERISRRVYNAEQTPQLVAPPERQRMTLIEGLR